MTISHEERATAVMGFFRENCSEAACTYLDCPSCGCMAYIAAAIREACNEKLEEAAEAAEDCRVPNGTRAGEWAGGFVDGKNTAARTIRALKDKSP